MRPYHYLPLLAAVATGMVAPDASAARQPADALYSQAEIRRYALALFEILSVRRIASERAKALPRSERRQLEQQAAVAIAAILARHGLDQARFNHITAAVNRQPALLRDVRQRVMREGLGFD